MFEANPKVGNVRNNGPELMRAAAIAAEDGSCRYDPSTLNSCSRRSDKAEGGDGTPEHLAQSEQDRRVVGRFWLSSWPLVDHASFNPRLK
jgi:hypothetical protein